MVTQRLKRPSPHPGEASGVINSVASVTSLDVVFAPVESQTAFEETLERLGTAINLGLLGPGTRLPAERVLCSQLGIARSTLRQALLALVQSGHLRTARGHNGGTFVADPPPPPAPPSSSVVAAWRQTCDARMAVETGVAMLAAERAGSDDIEQLERIAMVLDGLLDDFPRYSRADVSWHVSLAEATGSTQLTKMMTDVQAAMTELISHIAHPPEVLDSANVQHRRILAAIRRRDGLGTAQAMAEHLRATEHVLAGLLPRAQTSPPGIRHGASGMHNMPAQEAQIDTW